jgi:transketolase
MKNGRKVTIEFLTEVAEKDDKIILIIGDVGFSFMDDFKEKFPKQFLNTGVMEQSMMGIAVGLANMGFKPYVYTMKNFILLRPLEQVRNDICFSNANVKLLGVGGSEAYRFLGMSHNLMDGEEERLVKDLPNLNSYLNPKSEEQLKDNLLAEYKRHGSAYFAI